MWPFSKKLKQPEVNVDQDKLKQSIAAQLVFDPVTKQLKIKPKEDEPAKKEQGVVLECPYCKHQLAKYSERRFKCTHCHDWIYLRDRRLVTKEKIDRLREEDYKRRREEYLMESVAEDMAKLSITNKMIERREKELTKSAGGTPKRIAVLRSLFNEAILKIQDLHEMEHLNYNFAIALNRAGEESFGYSQAAAKASLTALKKDGYKKVSIFTNMMCDACKALDGEVMRISDALKILPIPIKECQNHPYNEDHTFCVCHYAPEYDDDAL